LAGGWAREFTKLVIKFDHAIPNNIGHFCDEILRDADFGENSRIAIVRSFVRVDVATIDISSRYYDTTARYYACFLVFRIDVPPGLMQQPEWCTRP
jgi:hypothetical protein